MSKIENEVRTAFEEQQSRPTIKSKVLQVAENSTLHGVTHLTHADSGWKKLLWIASFLFSLSIFCYLANRNLAEYLSWPVTTSIRFNNEQEIPFPGIAICNTNPFVTDKAVDFLIEFIENKTTYRYNSNESDKIEFVSYAMINNGYSLRYTAANLVYYNYSESGKKSFGLPIENMLIYCQFDGRKCNTTNWTWLYSFFNGNCFLFNLNNLLTVKSIGRDNGLSVELFVGHDETIPFYQKTTGLQIFLFNQTKYLKMEYYIPRVSIKPGSEVNIEVKRKFTEKLPKPYSECDIDLRTANIETVDSELYRTLFLTNKTYEQYHCFHLAYRISVFRRCGCVIEIGDVAEEDVHICSTKAEQDCRIYTSTVLFKTYRFFGEFDDQCPLECNTIDLEMKMSSESFPSSHYGEHLLKTNINFNVSNTFTLDDVRKSVARINFYYTKIGHEVLEELATMTVINLLANTGGMLGLFLGMSLLTLIEGVQILCDIFILMCRSPSRREEGI